MSVEVIQQEDGTPRVQYKVTPQRRKMNPAEAHTRHIYLDVIAQEDHTLMGILQWPDPLDGAKPILSRRSVWKLREHSH